MTEPTLPNPCTATVAPFTVIPRCASACFVTNMQPRPVASRRPSEPPNSTGLPVTTAVTVWPDVHGVGVHHPRHHALVGVHIRRRHVGVGAERRDDAGRIAPREPFELARRSS